MEQASEQISFCYSDFNDNGDQFIEITIKGDIAFDDVFNKFANFTQAVFGWDRKDLKESDAMLELYEKALHVAGRKAE